MALRSSHSLRALLLLAGSCASWAAAPTMANLNPATRPSTRTGPMITSGVGADGGEQEVLFGGNTLLSTNGQTWTYSPNTWTQRTPPTAPSARAWGVMTWDAQQQRAVLFGGSGALGGPLRQDTWAFDPLTNTWQQLTNAGAIPSARFLFAMVYVPSVGKHLLFGGGTATSNNAEATLLDNGLWWLTVNASTATATWAAISPLGTPPPARASACYGFDPVRGRLIIFGGEIVNDTLADTVEYDVASNTWFAITAPGSPTKRGSAVCTFDERTNKLALYGGVTTPSGTPQSAAFEYDPAGPLWRAITPSPSAGTLTFAGPTYSDNAGGMMFFGGRINTLSTSQATWTLRLNGTPKLTLPATLAFDEAVLATLSATVSDVDPTDTHTFAWSQDGGAPVTLSSAVVPQPTFTTPTVTSVQVLRFAVDVTDGVETAADFVDVTIRDSVNEVPLVDAGPAQAVNGGALVQLAGSAADPNGEAMTYAWSQRSGPTVTLSSTTTLAPTFTAPVAAGLVTLDLRATDTRAGVGLGSVAITLTTVVPVDAGPGDAGTLDGGVPSPDAGTLDGSVVSPPDAGTLDGSVVSPPDAGPEDAGLEDAGANDAGTADAGGDDAGSFYAGRDDAGFDAGGDDAGFFDAGAEDAGVAADGGSSLDAGTDDGGQPDAGRPQPRRELSIGCTCASIDAFPAWLGLLATALRRRRAIAPR